MAWRKWIVRSLVFTMAGGLVAATVAYQHWTDPAFVRQQVLAYLEEHFPAVRVDLESAHLRLLGGISFHELHLSRRDDPNRRDFIYVPSGMIYHDKEQLLSGKLVIRRIEFDRPKLRLSRGADGVWNVSGLAPPTTELPVPTIVFKQADLVLEDRRCLPDASPVEIGELSLVLMNDPHRPPTVSLLTFKGAGICDLCAAVRVEGALDRLSGEFSARLRLPRFPINGSLVERLSKLCPETAVHARRLTATGSLQAEVHYHPGSKQPWHHDVRWQLSRGRFDHARLPFPLENLEASVHCVDGQVTLEKLTAQSGATRLRLTGKALALRLDTDIFDGQLEFEHLRVSRELFAALPDPLRELEKDYAPQGAFGGTVYFSGRAGRWREHGVFHLEDMAGVCAKFPYRLDRITGTIDQELDPSASVDRVKVDLVGFTGSQPVTIQGEVTGKKPAAVSLQIRADNVPIDEKLCAALQPEFRKLVRSFQPHGFADIEAVISRPLGERHFANEFLIRFHDASIRYDIFPYPVEGVSGILRILPDRWEYHDCHGTHEGGEIHSEGKSVLTRHGKGAKIEITGTGILLDRELRASLRRPTLETAWEKLDPKGRMDFAAHVDLIPEQKEPDIDVTVTPRGCTIKPEFFPYALTDLRGLIHYRQHEVALQNLVARHGPTQFQLEKGRVLLHDDGGLEVVLTNVLGDPVVPDAEFIRALPPALAKACTTLRIKGLLSMRTDLSIAVPADHRAPPQIGWDGGVRFKNAMLQAGVPFEQVEGMIWCSGEHRGGNFGNVRGNITLEQATVYNQTLRNISSHLIVDAKKPDFLLLPNLHARLDGGDVGGAIRIQFGPSLDYQADLTALQIQLEELSRSNRLGPNAQQSGPLNAELHLTGQGTDLHGLKGWGSIDVPSGKMYNLPLLLDLLKFLSLRWPDKTLFEEAHARFTIAGPGVDISRIDLVGSAISFGGKGTVNLDNGAFNMELYAVWARIVQVSPPIIKEFWPALSKELLKIKMRGKLGEIPHFEQEYVPGLTEPLEKVRERLGGK
jgi:hypothetical protein